MLTTALIFVSVLGILHAHGNGAVFVTVKEDSDAVLPCSLSSNENLESKLFDWKKGTQEVFIFDAGHTYAKGFTGQDKQFAGRVSHFPRGLKNGNASIKISKTKVTDSGTYTCEFPRLHPGQTFSIQLVVESIVKDRSAENKEASSKPYIETLNATQHWALLQCEARGVSPKPKLVWKDSAGNILTAESEVNHERDKYNIALRTNVTKTDSYSCVLTQEELKHEITVKTFLFICGKPGKEAEYLLTPLVLVCLALGCLALGCLAGAAGLVLALKKCSTLRGRVFKYLSGPKPQCDSRQQNGEPRGNGFTTTGDPADAADGSNTPLNSSKHVVSSEGEV